MTTISLNAYAIFVENKHEATFFVPTEKDEWSVKITAALCSNPIIVLDPESDIPKAYRYSVYVDDEYVDKLYQTIEPSFFYPINAALQNNPTIVLIESGPDIHPGISWEYKNDSFIRKE
jgi:hypothetical protein